MRCILLAYALLGMALSAQAPPNAAEEVAWADPSPHTNAYIEANGVRLNYLDWGGTGPVLILIHGLCGDPHGFDDLAPAFTDRYRVIAYARRGHGRSEAKAPCDTATLTEDLRGLMDGLGIAKASLAGHSMGGNEVTAMAATHPDRVNRIIYLEGAYDWGDPACASAFEGAPFSWDPPASALKSMDAWRTWNRAVIYPAVREASRFEAEIRDLVELQPGGSVKLRMDPATAQAADASCHSGRRAYSQIHVPALAIFAETFVDVRHGDPAQCAKRLDWEQKRMAPFRDASIERLKRELRGVEIVRIPGTHLDYLFTSRETLVAALRHFLAGAPAAP